MEVAEHQVRWGREEAEEEREEAEEVLQMRRQKRPVTVTASGLSSGVAIESDIEEEEDSEIGSNSNYEHSVTVPENGKSKDEYSVPENGKPKDEYSMSKNGKTRDELSMPGNGHAQVFDYDNNGHDQSTVINSQLQGNTKDDISSDILLPTEKSAEDPKVTLSSENMIVRCAYIEVSKEEDKGSNDSEVERVLKEQDTHDLFCPNCHSCITKRVILRKRKRNVKSSDEDVKRNRPQVVDESWLDAISEHTTNNRGDTAIDITVGSSSQTPAADEYNRDTEPEVFRCLSCFTFFIPKGNGVNLSNVFGDKREKENLQNREQTSSTKKNWFFSLFGPRKVEVLLDRDVEANISVASGQEIGTSESPLVVSFTSKGPEVATEIVANTGEKTVKIHKEVTEAVEPANTHSGTLLPGKGTVHNVILEQYNTYYKPQRDGLQIFVEPSTETSALEKSQQDQKLDTRLVKDTDDKDWLLPKTDSVYGESENDKVVGFVAGFSSQNGQNIGVKQAMPTPSTVEVQNVGVTFSDSSYSDGGPQNNVSTKVDIHIEKTTANADASIASPRTSLLLPDRATNTTKYFIGLPEKTSAGNDTIITVTESQTETSQQAQDIIVSAGTGLSELREGSEYRDSRGVEVIKSIVYGGLVEIVTSLGVISSAAGSETAIINIVALGLANLVGGLFMLCHNLWDLRNHDYGVISNQANENEPNGRTRRLDKYQDLLGRRENFILHATLAILSYLIFGSLPPVIYGFSFHQSNDRYFKLLTVAVASLLCITVLAVCKAYVQRPPKGYIKTMFKYMSLGFMASGVSYVAGDLAKKSIEKLGWLSSGADLSLPMMRELPVQTGWGSS